VYCNTASAADKAAFRIASLLPETKEPDPEIDELTDFLRSHVHSKYRLADVLSKGVAFHYGNIPQIIRGRIEELLRERSLRFVCCTSTLLQGINLPAKNIFVENPRKGVGNPMQNGDFWNLVGRAGRMAKEFNGNVYCIFSEDWENDPFVGERLFPIKSGFAVALTERSKEVAEVAEVLPESSESKSDWAEQAYARIFSEFLSNGSLVSGSRLATTDNAKDFEIIDKSCIENSNNLTLPKELYIDNFYMHPRRLESLASHFRGQQSLESWLPILPWSSGAYDRLLTIFGMIETVFIRTGFQSYRYHAFLAIEWMKGSSLKDLITSQIAYREIGDDADKINDLIRELFKDLEDELRYKYVKYCKIYLDVLREVLLERGEKDDAESLLPLNLFLEYGASSRTLISLMSLGLSRTTAIILKRSMRLNDELDAQSCQRTLDNIDLRRFDLPAICRNEVKRIRRK
jgi:hypothetical protein